MQKPVQTSLFSKPKKATKPIKLTPVQKTYLQLKQNHFATKLHLFEGGAKCQSIALDYVDNGLATNNNLQEDVDAICKRANRTHSKHIYHYVNNHFLEYDNWLLQMVLKTELKKRADKQSSHESNAS